MRAPGLRALVRRALDRVRALARRRCRPPTSDALGRRGERVAATALRSAGYRVLARRVRTAAGEIDLLALDGETLVVVEVKASSVSDESDSLGSRRPLDRVDHAKRRRLAHAARALRGRRFTGRPRRIDAVSVLFDGRRSAVTIVRGAVPLARRT